MINVFEFDVFCSLIRLQEIFLFQWVAFYSEIVRRALDS